MVMTSIFADEALSQGKGKSRSSAQKTTHRQLSRSEIGKRVFLVNNTELAVAQPF
jgi:hypothetical protein